LRAITALPFVLLAWASIAQANTVRRMFEPTDLETESPGNVEVDLQMGVIRGRDPYSFSVPDFEIDLGLTDRLELDLDGAFTLQGEESGKFGVSRVVRDNLWLCLKLALLEFRFDGKTSGFSLGIQAGPKLPVAIDNHGLGLESLILAGYFSQQTHVALNAGFLIDPHGASGAARPSGIEGGITLERQLTFAPQWAWAGQVGGIRFSSGEAALLSITAGCVWSPSDSLDLSATGIAGLVKGSDRYGMLLGIAPKFAGLW
jgi:hypothetical protein